MIGLFLLQSTLAYSQAGIRAQGRDVNLGPGGNLEGTGAIGSGMNLDYQQEMRKLVRTISNFARRLDPNFIVMTQDGLDLLVKSSSQDAATSAPSSTYIKAIDGVVIKGLNFRPPQPGKDEIKTESALQKKLLTF